MSDAVVNGPGIWGNSSKTPRNWFYLFAFWALCGALALTVVWGKTHRGWFAARANNVESAYALKLLNFNMPDSYKDFAVALAQGKAVPDNYIAYYAITVQYMPDDFAGHYLLALALQSKGEWDKAAASYRQAIDHNPYFFWAYYNLGVLLARTGHWPQAREIFAASQAVLPQLTLKSLAATKLLLDCVNDPYFAGHDPVASLKTAYLTVSQALQGQIPPESVQPALF